MPMSFLRRCFILQILIVLSSGAKLSLICSGVSRRLPERLTLFFLSRSPPPPGGPQDVAGHVRLRDSAGVSYEQEISAVCSPTAPLNQDANLWSITDFVLQSCGSVIGKSGRLLEMSSTTKITCYKSYPDMPPLDSADGTNFHVAAQGESNLFVLPIPSVAVGDIQSIVAVTVDGINPAWLGISQPADPIEAMQPCADDTSGAQRVIYPCSAGRGGRWIWILVAPAGDGARRDCADPPTKKDNHLEQNSLDYKTTHLQSFCSNVPDGFICPVTCNANTAPTGSIQCKNGRWQRNLKCRERRKVCLAPFETVLVTTSGNSGNLWNIDGVVPDRRQRCDLFSRQGKKCQGTCSGGFGTGQLHCRRGAVDNSLAATGFWQARPNFNCNDPSQDSLYPRPQISYLQQEEADTTTIRITAKILRDPNIARSGIKEVIFKERRNRMKRSKETAPSSQTTSDANAEADDPEEQEGAARLLMSSVDGSDHPLTPRWLRPMSRRMQSVDTCEEGEFVQQGACLDWGEFGACWKCHATEVTTREQCWRGRSGAPGTPRGTQCGATGGVEGDFFTCRWVGFTEPQTCYARTPIGYCVKKICASQGGTKTCTTYDPPVYDAFCIGDPNLGVIDHAVIQYTCCDQNVVTYVGTVTGGRLDRIDRYELQVGAKNNAGTSWSTPRSITCAALVLTGDEAQKYVIDAQCAKVLPQGKCSVTCAPGYFQEEVPGTTNGEYTCRIGLGELLVGDPPKCLRMPGGNQDPLSGSAPVIPPGPPVIGGLTGPAKCLPCEALTQQSGYSSNNFATCRFWGDPHVAKSWRSNRRFDHQGMGVYRYATAETCAGGDFEVQVFQCQYKSGRNSVAIGVAVRLNNGKTVYVNERNVEASNHVRVEPSGGISVDSQGVNIYSEDKCAFVNVNVKSITRNPGYFHNVKINVYKEDLTEVGICGAPDLRNEYIAPDGGNMLFTAAQHTALCNQCISTGSLAPPGCTGGTAPTLSEDCSFMAPLDPASSDTECKPADHPLVDDAQSLGGSQNCVVYTILDKEKSCDMYCQERGSECVAFVDDIGGSNRICSLKGTGSGEDLRPKEVACSTMAFRDGHCVCRIPAVNAPGDDVVTACVNSDDGMTLLAAETDCKTTNPRLALAVYPPRVDGARLLDEDGTPGRRLLVVTDEQQDLDDSLKDCMVDVCSSDPADRTNIIQNSRTEAPVGQQNAARGCQQTDGLNVESDAADYPCNCAGEDCEVGTACSITGGVGSCVSPPTTTTVTTTLTTLTTTTETFLVPTTTVTASTVTSTSSTFTTTQTTFTSTTSATVTSSSSTATSTTTITETTSSHTSTTTVTTSSTTLTSTTSATTTSSTVSSTSTTQTMTSVTITSTTRTFTDTTTTSTRTSATETSSTVTVTSVTETSSTVTVTSVTSTSITATTLTTTTTYPRPNHCGPLVGTGGFITVSWDGGDVNSNTGQGTYEWRVYYTKHPREQNAEFLVEHCQDIELTSCDIYCLEPGATYDVRVNLIRRQSDGEVVVIGRNVRVLVVEVPFQRAGPPEDLMVYNPSDHQLSVSWKPSEEQGNCTFAAWVVEIQAMNGGWLQNPPGCGGLTQFSQQGCTLTGLGCDTPYQIQVKQSCANAESTSDWSRPIMAETLDGGDCADQAFPPDNTAAQTELIQRNPSSAGRRLASSALPCESRDYQLRLTWTAGEQQDSQFIVWYLEVYKLTIVAGVIVPDGNVQIPDVCRGILDRATTECVIPGMPFGLYAFAVQEISLQPETSSPLSEVSDPTWIPRRRAQAPRAVSLSQPSISGLRVGWVNMPLEDCPFVRTKVELSAGNAWFEPDGCHAVTDPTATSCSATGLLSNTSYVARVSVLCDECTNTPTSQRTECVEGDADDDICSAGSVCYRKLDAFRAASCTSAESSQVSTLPRRQASPRHLSVTVPPDSGVRVALQWFPGPGSASDSSLPSDCASQSYVLELKLQTEADWGTPEGCESLGSATTCTAIHLQCNTDYDARVRASCVPAAASSDWATFPRFSTSNVGTCLRPATAPQLIRATSVTPTSLEISFTAGTPGDCVFGGFELQYRRDGVDTWTSLPLDAGSLQVRAGPSSIIRPLLEGTGYFFRARELCNNGAPLNSAWANTEEPLLTSTVAPVGQPISIDPLGVITGTLVPQRLMLFFDTDLSLGNSSTELSMCPALAGTAENRGPCECESAADCLSKCVSRSDVSVLLMSARVLLVDFSSILPRPLTACPYDVIVEEGMLETQQQPAKLSPRVEWSFTYSPPLPVGSVILHASTTTSLTMHVSWDMPMTVRCGVRDGSGGLAHVSEEEDFTGARAFVEVRIRGLTPFTQYSVVCIGAAIGDSILTANVTADGVATQTDTDDTVKDINLNIQALCSDGREPQVVVPLFPPFDPSIRSYQVNMNADEMRLWCGQTETEAVLRIGVSADASSSFATVTAPEVQSMVQQLMDSNGQLPTGAATSTQLQVAISVEPANLGSTAPVPYTIVFVLGTLDLSVESSTLESFINLGSDSSASFSISVPSTLDAQYVGLRVGPFEQTLTLTDSQPVANSQPPRTLLTFNIANLVAMGTDLPVIIMARPPTGSTHPTLDVRTGLTVSTDPPVYSGVETSHGANSSNATVSLTEQTIVTISGTNLVVPVPGGDPIIPEIYIASVPVSCNTQACQESTLQSLLASGTPNMCSDTVITADNTLSCIVPPTGAGNLALCLLVRSGVFSEPRCGTVAPPYTVQPQLPAVGGISQPAQGMSNSEPFIVTVDGELPPESVSQGFLQVWASPFDFPPEDPANPGPGFVPLCADAVVTENNEIQCFRSQEFDVSQIGSNPNVFVQTGQDQISANLLPGALQILNPRITRIERSHEFEVGQLQLIVEGENFGTQDNGNMVCALESFGERTQSLLDLRLADALGDPSYITACEVVSHEDTKIVCNCIQEGNQQSVLGTPVDQEYYDEKIPTTGGDGRRLQEVDLATLALQLSPLPIAVSVSYSLDCEVLQRLNESCDPNVRPTSINIPQVREWQAVRLRPCPAGEHRINYTAADCLQCEPGKFKSGVGPALNCSLCDYGTYMGLPGAGACTQCPERETTVVLGATQIQSCDCAPGFYRIANVSQDWNLPINHGVCLPCPVGAICEGQDILPYSDFGYWTPERLTFWPCFPAHACLPGNALDPNLCEASREPTSRRCGQCAAGAFAHQSECYTCSTVDDILSWAGLLLWPVGVVVVLVPFVLRQIRSNDMSRTKKQKRMMKHDTNSCLGRLGLVDHGEFRMMIIMWTCLQMLWICSLMPLPFTSFAREWLWALGMFVFDLSIFRPQCALGLSYFSKWLTHWGLFFLMIVVLLVIMLIIGRRHKNARHDINWISRKQALLSMFSASLLLFTLVHLRDDLIFVQCIGCENGKACLAEQPVIYCDFSDWEWAVMASLSVLDLCFVIGATIPILAVSIFKSWKWQHGDEIALSSDFLAPWYIYISEMLVERHIGYIKEVREAVPEFEQAYKDLHTDAMRQEVWSKAIDIILAHEAERAEVFLRRIIRHLYNHNPRFTVIDEDSGPTFAFLKAILRDSKEDEEDGNRMPRDRVQELKAADIHHITLTLNQLLDTARFSIPGLRVVKRWMGYSWSLVLLLTRFAILTFAMLMPRDQSGRVPLAYMITKLVSLVFEAALSPYQWSYLNDWELVVHSFIYVFMMFVVSGWSDIVSNILLVIATALAVLPVILRVIYLLKLKDKHDIQDPTGLSVRDEDVSYHIRDMADGVGTRSLGISTVTTESIVGSGTLEHVRKSIEMVKKKLVTVVEKTVDDDGKEVERTTVTEETQTDAMTYSLDMTKSQVGRIMAGQPETPGPSSLEGIPEDRPEEEEGEDDQDSFHELESAYL